MTTNEIHATYGERIKRTLIANCEIDYVTASGVLLDTLAEAAKSDLSAYSAMYPVLPLLFSIAIPLADARRAA